MRLEKKQLGHFEALRNLSLRKSTPPPARYASTPVPMPPERRRSPALTLLILIMSFPLLSTCGLGSSLDFRTRQVITIKVATELPISDNDIGISTMNGAKLAVDQANANHTIPNVTLQLVQRDHVSNSRDSVFVDIIDLLGDPQVAGIVGPLNSGVARAMMPTANNGNLAVISPSNTDPCLTRREPEVGCGGDNDVVPLLRPTGNVTYFRLVATDDYQGLAMADYLSKTLHLKTVFVIDDAARYGAIIAKYFVQEFKKLGGTIIDGQSHTVTSTTNYTNLLTTAAAHHPDAIYFGGIYVTGGQVIQKQMMMIPALQKKIFAGGDGMIGNPDFYKQVTDNGGTCYLSLAPPDASKTPAAAQFVKDYTARYGTPGFYSASAFDAMNILIQAIKKALATTPAAKDANDTEGGKAFRQAVVNALKQTDYHGATGHTTFDANGDTTNRVFTIYQVALVGGKPDLEPKDIVTL
jgi:branched-chain amino acid transport system substrate-binding protein